MSKDWISKAVNPKHKGYCTPMTKSTCTPRRKALARTFKKMAKRRQEGGNSQEEAMMQQQMMQQQEVNPLQNKHVYSDDIFNSISNGGTHQQSPYEGVPVGDNALVEEGEHIFTDPTTKERYVFTDRYGVDGKEIKDDAGNKSKGKKSFADIAKSLENRYKRYKFDPVEKKDFVKEMNNLAQSNEEVRMDRKSLKEVYGEMMRANGGKISYQYSGLVKDNPVNTAGHSGIGAGFIQDWSDLGNGTQSALIGRDEAKNWYNQYRNNPNYDFSGFGEGDMWDKRDFRGAQVLKNPNGKYLVVPRNESGDISGYENTDWNSVADNPVISTDNNVNAGVNTNTNPITDNPINNVPNETTQENNPQFDNWYEGDTTKNDMYDFKPQYWKSMEGLAPLGAGLLGAGLQYGMAKPNEVKYDRVHPNYINLERERQIAKNEATGSRNTAMRGIRGATSNLGEYLGAVGGVNPAIDRALGNTLGKSYQNQEVYNAGEHGRSDMANAEIGMREQEMNARERDMANAQKMAAIQGGLGQLGQYAQNSYADKVMTANANMYFDPVTGARFGSKDPKGNMFKSATTFTTKGVPGSDKNTQVIMNKRQDNPYQYYNGQIQEYKEEDGGKLPMSFYKYLVNKRFNRK